MWGFDTQISEWGFEPFVTFQKRCRVWSLYYICEFVVILIVIRGLKT